MPTSRPGRKAKHTDTSASEFPTTPDGRYFVVRGRLWRKANPALAEAVREKLVKDLMKARREIALARKNGDAASEARARERVHTAKVKLGERGPVWWNKADGDHNRRMVANSPYAEWFAAQAGRQ